MNTDIEIRFAKLFFDRGKAERCLFELNTPKKRNDFIKWKMEWRIDEACKTKLKGCFGAEDIERHLIKLGIKGNGYVMMCDVETYPEILPLRDAINLVVDNGSGYVFAYDYDTAILYGGEEYICYLLQKPAYNQAIVPRSSQ